MSTAEPECCIILLKGGYKVHPHPEPSPTTIENNIKTKDQGSNQNLKLFSRGKAISGAVIIKGTNQFPNPPISIGITKKKIIIKA